MNITSIKIIAIGKIKTPFYKDACENYLKRIKNFCQIEEIIIKDADSDLPIETRLDKEYKVIEKYIQKKDYIICLDEDGINFPSTKLASKLDNIALEHNIVFILGGAYGLAETLRNKAQLVLAFGKQTFPHELARLVLYEQIFRTCSIRKKTGYHHENPEKCEGV